jgi:hypothetical protein
MASFRTLFVAGLVVVTVVGRVDRSSLAPRAARAQAEPFFVDTAADVRFDDTHCLAGGPCPLRSAIQRAVEAGGGTVTARACAGADDTGCLSTADPAYDAAASQWVFTIVPARGAVAIEGDDVRVDFAALADDWHDPGDNRFVIEGPATPIGQGVVVEAERTLLKAVTVRGPFVVAAVEARVRAVGNRIEGVSLEGAEAPSGFRIRDGDTVGNVLANNWCGLAADGATVVPYPGDCVRVDSGAHNNAIGEPAPSSPPNRWVAATGAGIRVVDVGTDQNVIAGNTFGLNAAGLPAGGTLGHAIALQDGAAQTQIRGNLIGGASGSAVLISTIGFSNRIEGNTIGVLALDGAAHRNAGWGIEMVGAKGTHIEDNTVARNARGIRVGGGGAVNNRMTRNRVYDNEGAEIEVVGDANNRVPAPAVSIVGATRATGTGCAGCAVEVYSGGDGARHYEGTTEVSVQGIWIFDNPDGWVGDMVSALESQNENTSSLSAPRPVPGRATATPTPSATSGTPGTGGFRVFLPWSQRR